MKRKALLMLIFIIVILALILIVVSISQSLAESKSKKEFEAMSDTSLIDINDLRIDHLVLNIDEHYQQKESTRMIEDVGLPYMPEKGKGTSGFKVSNLWIGDEYFEMVRIKKDDGGGWVPEWTERYLAGERGLVCLMLETDNMKALYSKLQKKDMSLPEQAKYKLFFGLLSISPPWKNAYMPFFEGVPFQIGFQQINNEKSKEKMYKRMNPNSRENGFTGISHIEIYGEFTQNDRKLIISLFTTKGNLENGDLVWELKNNQKIVFKQAEEYNVNVYLNKENNNGSRELVKIENVSIEVK